MIYKYYKAYIICIIIVLCIQYTCVIYKYISIFVNIEPANIQVISSKCTSNKCCFVLTAAHSPASLHPAGLGAIAGVPGRGTAIRPSMIWVPMATAGVLDPLLPLRPSNSSLGAQGPDHPLRVDVLLADMDV